METLIAWSDQNLSSVSLSQVESHLKELLELKYYGGVCDIKVDHYIYRSYVAIAQKAFKEGLWQKCLDAAESTKRHQMDKSTDIYVSPRMLFRVYWKLERYEEAQEFFWFGEDYERERFEQECRARFLSPDQKYQEKISKYRDQHPELLTDELLSAFLSARPYAALTNAGLRTKAPKPFPFRSNFYFYTWHWLTCLDRPNLFSEYIHQGCTQLTDELFGQAIKSKSPSALRSALTLLERMPEAVPNVSLRQESLLYGYWRRETVNTPIMICALHFGNDSQIKMLLEAGADPNVNLDG
jgi:hypothetical protein